MDIYNHYERPEDVCRYGWEVVREVLGFPIYRVRGTRRRYWVLCWRMDAPNGKGVAARLFFETVKAAAEYISTGGYTAMPEKYRRGDGGAAET